MWRYSRKGTGRPFVRFLDHTQLDTHTHIHIHTPGRTPLHEWSACCRGRYLNNTQKHKTAIFVLSAGFEPAIPAIEQMQNYSLDRKPPILCHSHMTLNLDFFQQSVRNKLIWPSHKTPAWKLCQKMCKHRAWRLIWPHHLLLYEVLHSARGW